MLRHEIIKQMLEESNPDAVLLDGFDEALVGIAERINMESVGVYQYDLCIEILQRDMAMENAEEYFQFNVLGAWFGEGTPVIMTCPNT